MSRVTYIFVALNLVLIDHAFILGKDLSNLKLNFEEIIQTMFDFCFMSSVTMIIIKNLV